MFIVLLVGLVDVAEALERRWPIAAVFDVALGLTLSDGAVVFPNVWLLVGRTTGMHGWLRIVRHVAENLHEVAAPRLAPDDLFFRHADGRQIQLAFENSIGFGRRASAAPGPLAARAISPIAITPQSPRPQPPRGNDFLGARRRYSRLPIISRQLHSFGVVVPHRVILPAAEGPLRALAGRGPGRVR